MLTVTLYCIQDDYFNIKHSLFKKVFTIWKIVFLKTFNVTKLINIFVAL